MNHPYTALLQYGMARIIINLNFFSVLLYFEHDQGSFVVLFRLLYWHAILEVNVNFNDSLNEGLNTLLNFTVDYADDKLRNNKDLD